MQRGGFRVTPGADDSIAHTSSIAKRAAELPAWEVDEATWSDTVACLQRIYAPFAVTITEDDPGDTPHIAAVFGGSPTQLGLPRNTRGYSPLRSDCSIIESSIVFAFAELEPDAATACRTMAQEIGHSYGLDHELRKGDVMSVQSFAGERTFADEEVHCGESTARPCGVTGACGRMQSSYSQLIEKLGPAGDGTPITDDGAGCATSRGSSWLAALAIALSTSIGRARARRRGARAPR